MESTENSVRTQSPAQKAQETLLAKITEQLGSFKGKDLIDALSAVNEAVAHEQAVAFRSEARELLPGLTAGPLLHEAILGFTDAPHTTEEAVRILSELLAADPQLITSVLMTQWQTTEDVAANHPTVQASMHPNSFASGAVVPQPYTSFLGILNGILIPANGTAVAAVYDDAKHPEPGVSALVGFRVIKHDELVKIGAIPGERIEESSDTANVAMGIAPPDPLAVFGELVGGLTEELRLMRVARERQEAMPTKFMPYQLWPEPGDMPLVQEGDRLILGQGSTAVINKIEVVGSDANSIRYHLEFKQVGNPTYYKVYSVTELGALWPAVKHGFRSNK